MHFETDSEAEREDRRLMQSRVEKSAVLGKAAAEHRLAAVCAERDTLKRKLRVATEALKSFPLEAFNKDMDTIDAAEFVDASADFMEAMQKARVALAEIEPTGDGAGAEERGDVDGRAADYSRG